MAKKVNTQVALARKLPDTFLPQLAEWFATGAVELTNARYNVRLEIDHMEQGATECSMDLKLPDGRMLSIDLTIYDK